MPSGLTVIEASAGTGKTYALAGLATRAIAERGLAASELCIVTFTEAATAELRGRVRDRLVAAAAHLAAGCPPTDDDVLDALGRRDGDPLDDRERVRRLASVTAAVTDFDAATISTIHGFCSRVVASGGGSTGAITDDDTDIRELVVDRFLRDHGHSTPVPFDVEAVLKAVKLRLRMPSARMYTVDCDEWAEHTGKRFTAKARVRAALLDQAAALVDDLVADVLARRATERRRTFDGLISEARDALAGGAGTAIVAALRKRFSLVMVDEFQDTDAVQWDIFRRAFLEGPADPVDTVIVGDPKQSIYRFRSAELSAYLTALEYAHGHGGEVVGLGTNWRTDQALLEALDQVFAGVAFGHPSVAFRPVDGAPGSSQPRFFDTGPDADPAPLQFRHRPGDDDTRTARAGVAVDLVAEVVRLLEHAELVDDGERRRLQASDIGILVRSNVDADAYAEALAAAGVPAARSSGDSVLDSAAARQWRALLVALDRPASPGAARAAALGWFFDDDASSMVDLGDDAMADLAEQLRRWAGLLVEQGLPAMLGAVRGAGLPARVLVRPTGERDLTDLDHVAELLNTASGGRRTSPAALLGVLDEMALSGTTVADDEGVASEVLARRIDRDDDTVKILTVHKAKGLEFPVVLCPTMWTQTTSGNDIGHGWIDGTRYVNTNAIPTNDDGAGTGPVKAVAERNAEENQDEARRLLYVALTRAKHRLVVWWARPPRGGRSELQRVLEGAGDGEVDLPALAARSDGRISVVEVTPPLGEAHHRHPSPTDELSVAVAHRPIDRRWAIWSFTGIAHAAHAAGAHRPPDPADPAPPLADLMDLPPDLPPEGGNDEPALVPVDDEPVESGLHPLPLLDVPGGKAFGTLVHSVLEDTDFGSATLAADLHDRCAEALRYRPLPVESAVLADGLVGALSAPLGGPLGPVRLVDLPRVDRLDELSFDVPLGRLSAARVADALLDHLPADDPVRPWAERAAAGALAVDVAGMITGSIDLVARTPDGRFWLADYKTNRLRDTDYDRSAMASAMNDNGYPLQATLYLVALHRYLRWRLAERYDPEHQLLGAAYLFVRGMDPARAADDTRGVFWWCPPVAALDTVDRLLATGEEAA
nr:UvrD-helicase domain-containing protein [Rhabdothermincola salaria]